MAYLIDGHNLIPKVDLHLEDPQDEMKLVALVQDFCRIRQVDAEIYFDGARHGQATRKTLGRVKIHFSRPGFSADAAIESRLLKLGSQSRNWIVVSSDNRVKAAGHHAHARVMSSEEFSNLIAQTRSALDPGAKEGSLLDDEQVEEWMEVFKSRKP